MSALLPPPQTRTIGRVNVGGSAQPLELDIAWFLYLTQGLYERAGGAMGPSTTDLETAAFEDAGIEEIKATLYALADEVRSLPPVVQLPQAAATGGGATWTETEIDFGSAPVYTASFTITDGTISAASKVQVLPCGKAATGRTSDDWAWDGATFAALPASGSATCYAVFSPGPIVGRRKVQYSIGA